MRKIVPKKYPKVETLEDEKIQKELVQLVSTNHYETYQQELSYVLDSFQNFFLSSKYQGGYGNIYSVYQDEIKATIDNIKKCVKLYLQGNIYSSFNTFNRRWKKLWNTSLLNSNTVFDMPCGTVIYKLRRAEKKTFEKTDFFHVPFSQRGKIGNNRFSISGYPCLYLGYSVYTCWEELRRPKLSEISAVGFKVAKDVKLLDLRLKQKINSMAKEQAYITLLPYILASSIRVHCEDDFFKPEYIISQLLLHSVIRKTNDDSYNYDGVIYTSTRRNLFFDDLDIDAYNNIAIPAMSNKYRLYDKYMSNYFVETEPIYLEHEYLKGFLNGLNLLGGNKYNNTIFHKLETILKEKEFNPIL